MNNINQIKENYENVLEEIRNAANSVSRDPEEIKLIVVTKTETVNRIKDLYSLGIRDFGENRVEDAIDKIGSFKDNVQWHMIGHVQSRKAEQVSENFGYLHSLDSFKLASRLNRFAAEKSKILSVLLQINVSGELSKSGWQAADEKKWESLIPEFETILELPNIKVNGLMTMAPYGINPEKTRPVFVRLRKLREYLARRFPKSNWKELSMGMSSDFQVAVQEGASFLRIGTKLVNTK